MERHAIKDSFERVVSGALSLSARVYPPVKKIEKKIMVRNTAREAQQVFDFAAFWSVTYPSFMAIGIVLTPLYISGLTTVEHEERLPLEEDIVILYANHPSLWEPIILKRLAWKQALLHPYRRMPWSTPDPATYNKPWWLPMRQRFIFVDRKSKISSARAFAETVCILRAGAWLDIHPEAMRTSSAGPEVERLRSRRGYEILPFKEGLASMALLTGATVVPVGVIGTDGVNPRGKLIPRVWNPVVLKVGHPKKIERITYSSKKERKQKLRELGPALTLQLQQNLLDTLDE